MHKNELISDARIQKIVSLIDLTNLNDDCDYSAIETLCAQSNTPAGTVAAVCIWPAFITDAKKLLTQKSPVKIATVVNFPLGNDDTHQTCMLIEKSLKDGADEIDYVLPYAEIIKGNDHAVATALQAVRKIIPDQATLKVILETGVLESNELIQLAASIAIDQGADFIKTSTGKVPVNATPNAAAVMLDSIAKTAKNVGFKAAGGIKSVDDANLYLTLAEQTLGHNWVNADHFRFGASSLLQNALDNLSGSVSTPSDNDANY